MANFKEKLRDAGHGGVPTNASLRFLSDLPSEDRATLREDWPSVSAERRRHIVRSLAELAEDNLDLNFRYVFLTGLDDSDAKVRMLSIDGLAEDNSKLLLNRLLILLRNDPDERVRERAAQALARFTYLAECDKLGAPADKLRETLIETARDLKETSDVRRRAIEALGYLHGDADVQKLIAGAYALGGRAAESAVFAMGRSMDERWQQIVMDELESEIPAMRYEAAHAAGEMILEDALPLLVRLLNDRDAEVKLAAIWALGQIGGKPAAQALAPLLKSDEPALREAAQEAINEIAFSANPLTVL